MAVRREDRAPRSSGSKVTVDSLEAEHDRFGPRPGAGTQHDDALDGAFAHGRRQRVDRPALAVDVQLDGAMAGEAKRLLETARRLLSLHAIARTLR
jgi:hypothetical protein